MFNIKVFSPNNVKGIKASEETILVKVLAEWLKLRFLFFKKTAYSIGRFIIEKQSLTLKRLRGAGGGGEGGGGAGVNLTPPHIFTENFIEISQFV